MSQTERSFSINGSELNETKPRVVVRHTTLWGAAVTAVRTFFSAQGSPCWCSIVLRLTISGTQTGEKCGQRRWGHAERRRRKPGTAAPACPGHRRKGEPLD